MRPVGDLPLALSGLHPVAPHPCPRCGTPTAALANGRGRLDICGKCGTFEMVSPEGLEIFSLREHARDLTLPMVRRGRV